MTASSDIIKQQEKLQWHSAVLASALVEGTPLAVEIHGRDVAIYRVGGSIYATAGVCTHQFALMTDGVQEDDEIECPLHAARFRISTGEVLEGPAECPLQTFPIRVEEGKVLVGMPSPESSD